VHDWTATQRALLALLSVVGVIAIVGGLALVYRAGQQNGQNTGVETGIDVQQCREALADFIGGLSPEDILDNRDGLTAWSKHCEGDPTGTMARQCKGAGSNPVLAQWYQRHC